MRHQQVAGTEVALGTDPASPSPFITDCHRLAIEDLGRAFAEARPLATLVGEGKSAARFVIRSFLSGIDDDVDVVRITEPGSDAVAFMRNINQAIGFESKDMSADDLQNVFAMFLSYQKTHRRRTIVCIEEVQDSGRWVLDKVRRLVEMESQGRFGLTVILSGQPSLNELLYEPLLDKIAAECITRISLAPFTIAETTEYIRRRVESAGTADITQVFEYHAIALVRELSAGVPDIVSDLCTACLQLADEENIPVVTTDLVKSAGRRLRLASMLQQSDAEAESEENELILNADENDVASSRFILTHKGETLHQMTMEGSRMIIGRSADNDLQIDSKFASRHHALIIRHDGATIVMDLNSTNGTYVNSRRISSQVVIDQDIITIGDHGIKVIDPTAQVRTTLEGSGFDDTAMMKTLDDMRKVLARENLQEEPAPEKFRKSAVVSD